MKPIPEVFGIGIIDAIFVVRCATGHVNGADEDPDESQREPPD